MSEANPAPRPNELIHNPDLVWDMAHAQKPYWEDARLLSESGEPIGLSATGRAIAVSAIKNSGIEAVQTLQDNWVEPSSEPSSPAQERVGEEALTNQETLWSPEKIKEFVADHTAGACICTNMFDHRVRSKGGRHRTLSQRGKYELSEFITKDLGGSLTAVGDEESKQFSEAGISELITVVPTNTLIESGSHGYESRTHLASKFNEDSFMIFYKTMTRGGKFDTQDGPDGSRPGRYTTFTMLVKKAEAVEFMEQLKQRPEMVRDVMDSVVNSEYLDYKKDLSKQDGKTGSGTSIAQYWSGDSRSGRPSRPSYDKFKEINGGVNRIALRTDLNAGPNQAEILEF